MYFRLNISFFTNNVLDGIFSFYKDPDNPAQVMGSNRVTGDVDNESHIEIKGYQ